MARPQDVTGTARASRSRDGRLAWATPPGQGGEGSRVQIVAWTDDDGRQPSRAVPSKDVVVVH